VQRAVISAFKGTKVMASIIVLGIIVHAVFTNELGLYRDDAWILMQGLIAADRDPMSFILSDTTGYLLKERPLASLVWMLARIGFTIGLPTLHWILVGLLILNAIILASITRKIVDEDWFIFVVAVIFLTYPLSPTQAIWASCIIYLVGCLIALLAALFFLYGLGSTTGRRSFWFVLASGSYFASLLTHEEFFMIPPTFVGLYLLFQRRHNEQAYAQKMPIRQSLIGCGVSFLVTLVLYFSWRKLLLPLYEGNYSYGLPNYHMSLDPLVVAKRFLAGVDTVFIPWDRALYQISLFRPPIWAVSLTVIVFAAVWIISFALLPLPSDHKQNEKQEVRAHQWLQPLTMGVIAVLTLLSALAFSETTPVESINGIRSRVNFAALVGVALALPAFFALLVQWRNRKVANVIAVSFVLAAGFTHPLVLLNDPTVRTFLNRYNLSFILLAIACISGTAFVLLTIGYLTSLPRLLRADGMFGRRRAGLTSIRIRMFVLSGIIAFFVLIGSLFQVSVKYEWASAWKEYKTMLGQLQSIAPMLEDDTFVLIVGNADKKPFRNIKWRVVSGFELSVHMLALYDNWSIMGYLGDPRTDAGLQFYPDGFEICQEQWFPPGVKGPLITSATMPVSRITYDRLLLFEVDHNSLRLLPEMEVKTADGEHLMLINNPERILATDINQMLRENNSMPSPKYLHASTQFSQAGRLLLPSKVLQSTPAKSIPESGRRTCAMSVVQ
jgi:hypothetical protein